MAFDFSNAGSSGEAFGRPAQTSTEVQVRDGPELQEITTDQLGFSSVNGEARLRLLSTPWPDDALPPPTSSLLAVASSKHLIAAAGPDELVLTSTESVRDALRSVPEIKDEKIRSISPQMRIPQSRLTHVAFSSNESVLVTSRQEGGGLVVFEVDAIKAGKTDPKFEMSTNGMSLRALVPNPAPDTAALFALATSNGELLLADLDLRNLRPGINGKVLKSGVSCLSWSNKGKQLVAGLADGTATQMKPDGTVVAVIPKSATIPADCHVSGISWLENDSFFIIYTPNDTNSGSVPSEYYIVTREPKTTNYVFQKLPEVVPPFGLERTPSFHFITRLRTFPPHIRDILILAATTGSDIALLSKTDKSLSQQEDDAGNFTLTTNSDDTRRAALPLPLSSGTTDTSPIGMCLDLSSTEKVPNPIPSDVEIIETDGPAPNLLVLNNEGILASWWLIYNDSVREKTLFTGFASSASETQSREDTQPLSESAASPAPPSLVAPTGTFGQPRFDNATSFGKPVVSTFGSNASQSGFGNSSSNAFGKPGPVGSDKPSWTSAGFGNSTPKQDTGLGFGQPAFGSATPIGNAAALTFGSASVLGGRPSPFGQPAAALSPTFGKPSTFGSGFGTTTAAIPFGATSSDVAKTSGFTSFSKTNGFAAYDGAKNENSTSPFATGTGNSIFAQTSSESPFIAKTDGFSGFGGTPSAAHPPSLAAAGAFKLESSFKGDGTAKDDLPKPKDGAGFGFGGLGNLLSEPEEVLSPTHDTEAEMGDNEDKSDDEPGKTGGSPFNGFLSDNTKPIPQTLVTPPSTLMQPKTTPAPPVSNLFGMPNQQTTTPLPQSTTPAWSFNQVPSTTPKETPAPSHSTLFGTTPQSDTTLAAVQKSETNPTFGSIPKFPTKEAPSSERPPFIKQEPPSDDESVDLSKVPEAPLPPDTVSKPRYASGDTSVSSINSKSHQEDAPLPPDFLPANRSADTTAEQPSLPSDEDDDFSSDFEGSGEDVTGDVSAVGEGSDDQADQVQTSPESSFKSGERSPETSPTGGLFTKVSTTTGQKQIRPLFGEVRSGPIFPPPKPHESPRSPSPIRHLIPTDTLRADPARSVSAPAHPRLVADKGKREYVQSGFASHAARQKEEDAAKAKILQDNTARSQAQTQTQPPEILEDDEDQKLQKELDNPVSPSQLLDSFMTYQPKTPDDSGKTGIPAQIERLYRDINSMVYTLGINARSLSAFMQYQTTQEPNDSWPSVLDSETPMDALNDEWVLDDISRLHEGQNVLETALEASRVSDVSSKLLRCQTLLGHDLFELRTKLTSIRKTLHAKNSSDNGIAAPLSAEQASIQHDLRKASTSVQSKLLQMEDHLSVLRAKLAEISPPESASKRESMLGRPKSQKKPTVEAVTNTIAKMTSMAEKKSADIDLLEAQLKKLDTTLGTSTNGDHNQSPGSSRTPSKGRRSLLAATPGSGPNSVYHTPDSKFGGSVRSTPGNKAGTNHNMLMVTAEDRERWQTKLQQQKDVASILKAVLEARRKRGSVKA